MSLSSNPSYCNGDIHLQQNSLLALLTTRWP